MQLSLEFDGPVWVISNHWNPGYHLCTIQGDPRYVLNGPSSTYTWRHGEQPGQFESVPAAIAWAQQRGVTPTVHPCCRIWLKRHGLQP